MSTQIEFEWCPDVRQREELKIYNNLLDKSIAGKAAKMMPNSGKYHAALMISKLFQQTNSRVSMVVDSFSGEVSEQPNYQSALDELLEKPGIKIDVLFLGTPNIGSTTYLKLLGKKIGNGNIELKTATSETKALLLSSFSCEELLNFSIFDDDKFRLEISPKSFSAFGSFNDKARASRLQTTFNNIYQTGETIN